MVLDGTALVVDEVVPEAEEEDVVRPQSPLLQPLN